MHDLGPHGPVRFSRGHAGWAFAGRPDFEGGATSFLAGGALWRQRLWFVADDPSPERWPSVLLDSGDLVVLSVSELYGPGRTVDARAQRATLEAAVSDALRDGYSGLRVVADDTSLIAGPGRLAAWLEWERVCDVFIRANPVAGLCAFDRTRVDEVSLGVVVGAHEVTAVTH